MHGSQGIMVDNHPRPEGAPIATVHQLFYISPDWSAQRRAITLVTEINIATYSTRTCTRSLVLVTLVP